LRQQRVALDRLNWDDLRLLLAIADTGTVRGTARDTGLSVNTVRARLEAMEHQVGSRLVERSPRGLVLTADGEDICAVAARMREASTGGSAAKAEPPQHHERTISLSITEGLACFWLMPHLAAFGDARPDVVLNLRTENSATAQDESDADVTVHLRPWAGPTHDVRVVGTLHLMPFASPAYLAQRGTPRHFSEWRDHRPIWQDWEPDPADILPLFIADDAPGRIIAMTTNSTSSQYVAIAAGLGLGFLPTYFSRVASDILPVDFGMAFRRTIYIATRQGTSLREIDVLVETLESAFADPALFGEAFVAPPARAMSASSAPGPPAPYA